MELAQHENQFTRLSSNLRPDQTACLAPQVISIFINRIIINPIIKPQVSNLKFDMKREGRQHGMVRTYLSPMNSRTINVVESPPTAGIFTKVNSSKPTNHSKFSAKCGKPRCGGCHLHPACKSSEKTKGSLKLRGQNDDFSRLRLLTWRVVDSRPGMGMNFAKSSSASEILAQLDEEEDGENDDVSSVVDFDRDVEMDGGDEIEIEEEKMDGGDGDGDLDETMSFCEVGYFWEQVEGDDDSWCWVAEIKGNEKRLLHSWSSFHRREIIEGIC